MFKKLLSAVLVSVCLAPLSGLLAAADDPLEWRFRVLLNDREIGFHQFRVSPVDNGERVEINAEFNVRVLFINAYSYTHQNEEHWQGNCLHRLESTTDDNGDLQRVVAEPASGGFTVTTLGESTIAQPGCIRSFAYWNPDFLDSTRLLNAQTGEVVDVRISQEQDEILQINGEAVPASRYAIEMSDGTISLWYSRDSGYWLALEAPTPGGRVLRYEPVDLPFALPVAGELALR